MLASDHREISARGTHNLDDKDHKNLVVNSYKQFHEDLYVERHFEHLTHMWARTW